MRFASPVLPILLSLAFAAPGEVFCQHLEPALFGDSVKASVDVSESAPSELPAATASSVSSKVPQPVRPLTARWLDITTFTHSERYRNQYGQDGFHFFESGQERTLLTGKVKLDDSERYFVGFRASTGRTFNWSYADFAGLSFSSALKDPVLADAWDDDPDISSIAGGDPAGTAQIRSVDSMGWQFYLRDLYLSATPIKAVTLEVGSFGIEKGFSTEITSFDEDGYIAGERIRLNDPRHLFFDQVTLTSAYFGDFFQPNVFNRGASFTKSNYRQIAGKKQLTKRIGISGEYNWISLGAHTSTTREAIVVQTPESHVIDRFRVEAYEMNSHIFLQGNDTARRQGFAIVGEKKLGKLSGDFGFASINRDYGVYTGSSFQQEIGLSLNGDNYNTGVRVFSHLNYKVTPAITAFGFYTRITGQNILNINSQGLNAGLTFDVKEVLNSGKRVF